MLRFGILGLLLISTFASADHLICKNRTLSNYDHQIIKWSNTPAERQQERERIEIPWQTCDGSLLGDGTVQEFEFIKPSPDTYSDILSSRNSENISIVEEILWFLEMGEENIEMSDQKDIVLVVGMTGSGKSTLVQFLAGQPTQLESKKLQLSFTIHDHCGSVSNSSIISKTLLPELTVEEESQTVLYDCPGFSDSRNESVEIANSFFIKKVADHGENLKIIIVVPHYAMSTNERNYFIKLLKQLALFIKNVDKLSNGIAFLTTMVQIPNGFNEADVFASYKDFFDIVKGEIDQVWGNDPHLDRGKEILEIIKSTNSNGDLTRVGIFRNPEEEGYLDGMPMFECGKENLKQLFYGNIEYCSKDDDDFGFGLSAEATNLITDVVLSIDKTIATNLTVLSSKLEIYYKFNLNNLANGQQTSPDLPVFLKDLLSSSYPICENSPGLSPSIYSTEITDNIKKFSTELMGQQTIADMERNTNFLVILVNATDSIEINPHYWVVPLKELKTNVSHHIISIVSNVDASITNELLKFSESQENYFIQELDKLENGGEIIGIFDSYLRALLSTLYPKCEGLEKYSAEVYTKEILENINTFSSGSVNFEIQLFMAEKTHVLVFLQNATQNLLQINPNEWTEPLVDMKLNVSTYLKKITNIFFEKSQNALENILTIVGSNIIDVLNNKNLSVQERLKIADPLLTSAKYLVTQMSDFINQTDKSANEFVVFALDELKITFGNYTTKDSIDAASALVKYLEFLESFGNSEWIPQQNWLEPFSNLQTVVDNEHYWLKTFIMQLFENLSEINVQVDGQWSLKTWWLIVKQVTSENLADFLETFGEVPAIKHLNIDTFTNLINDSQKLASLNTLLDSTLAEYFPCTKNATVCECTGNYVSLKKAYEFALNSNVEILSIIGYYTVFLDIDIMGSTINREKNVKIFALSPIFQTRALGAKVTFDLKGAEGAETEDKFPGYGTPGAGGKPGDYGRNAGSVYLIGQEFENKFSFNLNGAKGSVGQDGQDGMEGVKGERRYVSDHDDAHCAAWTGEIEVKLFPHMCNGDLFESNNWKRCKAGNSGADVILYGTPGGRGYDGGRGGIGGVGGDGGLSILVDVNKNESISTAGVGGVGGAGGMSGAAGPGGLYGDTNQMKIDDMTPANKECEVTTGPFWSQADKRVEEGTYWPQASSGANGTSSLKPDKVPSQFSIYLENFKAEANKLVDNEFFMDKITPFLENLEGHKSLP